MSLPHCPSTTVEQCRENIASIRDQEAGFLCEKHQMNLESNADGDMWTVEFEADGQSLTTCDPDPTTAIIRAATRIERTRR